MTVIACVFIIIFKKKKKLQPVLVAQFSESKKLIIKKNVFEINKISAYCAKYGLINVVKRRKKTFWDLGVLNCLQFATIIARIGVNWERAK